MLSAKMKRSLCCLALLLVPGLAIAAEAPLWEVGVRGGYDATGVTESYSAGELALMRQLPWGWDVAGGKLTTRLDAGAGYLEAAGDHGGWLAVGGDLVYRHGNCPLELEAGWRPAWLFDDTYGADDFGGSLQFISHVGVALHLRGLVFSYRFQHMSNAGLEDPNPGLDLHMFGVAYRF